MVKQSLGHPKLVRVLSCRLSGFCHTYRPSSSLAPCVVPRWPRTIDRSRRSRPSTRTKGSAPPPSSLFAASPAPTTVPIAKTSPLGMASVSPLRAARGLAVQKLERLKFSRPRGNRPAPRPGLRRGLVLQRPEQASVLDVRHGPSQGVAHVFSSAAWGRQGEDEDARGGPSGSARLRSKKLPTRALCALDGAASGLAPSPPAPARLSDIALRRSLSASLRARGLDLASTFAGFLNSSFFFLSYTGKCISGNVEIFPRRYFCDPNEEGCSFDGSNEASPASQVRPGGGMAGGRMDTSGRARARSAVREDLLLEQES